MLKQATRAVRSWARAWTKKKAFAGGYRTRDGRGLIAFVKVDRKQIAVVQQTQLSTSQGRTA